MRQIPFTLSDNEARSSRLSPERLINAYAEPQDNARYPYAIYGTPGLVIEETYGIGPIRGRFHRNNDKFVVSGSSVYKNGALLSGAGIAGSGAVSMAANNSQVVIVGGGGGYVVTDTVSNITDPDWKPADTVTYLKGVFVFNERGSGRAFSSAIEDATDLNALDFATAESKSDDLVGVYREGDKLVLAGRDTIEFWYYDAGPQFPFSAILGATIDMGILSPHAVVFADNTFFFLGHDLAVYRMGQVPQRISNPYYEDIFRSVPNPEKARASYYSRGGHGFIVFDFDQVTCVYDLATGGWHERKSYNKSNWRCSFVYQDGAKVYAADRMSGKSYLLDENAYDEAGEILPLTVRTPNISNNQERFSISELLLDMETGVGISNGQGFDPQIMMRYSDDGGKIWSNEQWKPIGKIGKYKDKAVWYRQGSAFERSFEFTITDPVKRAFLGLWANG